MAAEFAPKFKSVIYENIRKKLYGQGMKLIEKTRSKIAWQNGRVHFYYAGLVYNPNGERSNFGSRNVTDLASEFTAAMDETLRDEMELKNEEHIVMTYVRRAINIGETVADFRELLPEILYDYFPIIATKALETTGHNKITLSKPQIIAFVAENTFIVNTIKSRLMSNLLLRDH